MPICKLNLGAIREAKALVARQQAECRTIPQWQPAMTVQEAKLKSMLIELQALVEKI